jgi:hypothetical protein
LAIATRHGIDAEDRVIIRRQLKRRYVLAFFAKLPPCLIGIEACATSHHWSRELQSIGHTVRLMPPAYVKPYVKRQKNDACRFRKLHPLDSRSPANQNMIAGCSQLPSFSFACCVTVSSRDDGLKPKSWCCGINSTSCSSVRRVGYI